MANERIEYEIDISTDDSDNVETPKGQFTVFDEDDDTVALLTAKPKTVERKGEPAADEDLDIEVVEDTPVAAASAEPELAEGITEEEMASYSENVKKRIGQLTRKQREAERQRVQLSAENNEAVQVIRIQQDKLKELAKLIENGEKQYVAAAGMAVAASVAAAKAKVRDALESGDPDKIADAQADLVTATVQEAQTKTYRSVAPAIAAEIEQTQRPQRQAAAQEFEPDPAAKKWMGRNEWFAEPQTKADTRMRNFAIEFANSLESDGYDPVADAAEYYSEIDKELRTRFPERFPAKRAAAAPAPQGRQTTAPTAGANNSNAPAKRKVTLTASQVKLAQKMGVPLAEYAKEYARMYGGT